jgi:hypothetical protein
VFDPSIYTKNFKAQSQPKQSHPGIEWHKRPARLRSAVRKSGRSGGSGANTLAHTRARRNN